MKDAATALITLLAAVMLSWAACAQSPPDKREPDIPPLAKQCGEASAHELALPNSARAIAKDKKLKPSEYEGGGFSVSNLGMYGIKNFTSIINPPQSCIIAVGAGEERPVVVNGKIEIATVMTVTMSADHRVVDGGTGARFLQTLKQFIEEPASMLL